MCADEGGGRRWEALPPILLLLKSSHERPCQELQCGLSRPSQRQSRLHDAATHTLTQLISGATATAAARAAEQEAGWCVKGIEEMQEEERPKKS